MGIKGLKGILKKKVPNAFETIELDNLSGKKIAIDSSILLYRFRYTYSTDNFHILGFMYKIIELIEHGIIPVFVFDGKPPEAKTNVLNKRNEQKVKSTERINELNELKSELLETIGMDSYSTDTNVAEFISEDSDSDSTDSNEVDEYSKFFKESVSKLKKIEQEIKKIKKNNLVVKRVHSQEVIELLKTLGIPYYQAEGEAEEACAFLQKNGLCDYVLTEDTDSLTFGATKVIFNTKKEYTVCSLEQVLEGINFTTEQFIDFCILCGCDYTCSIPKVGPVSAFNTIKTLGSISKFMETNKKYSIPESFEPDVARMLFLRNNEYTIPEQSFEVGKPNKEELVRFLKKNGVPDNSLNYFMFKF